MTPQQLPLPIDLPTDPNLQLAAARRLQKLVDANVRSFECQQYRKHRAAALKFTRPALNQGDA